MKELLAFIIGIIIGFGCSIVFFLAASIDSERSDGVVRGLQTFARGISQEKGAILYPKSYEREAMEATFEANDRAGIDTNVGEIEGDV